MHLVADFRHAWHASGKPSGQLLPLRRRHLPFERDLAVDDVDTYLATGGPGCVASSSMAGVLPGGCVLAG